jgi:diguanylate cyclase (GGDEF)-like protein
MSDRITQVGLPVALLASGRERSLHWLEGLLESGGYAVLSERSGEHVLVRARTAQPDAVIVDADLPDMAGVELCRILRNDPHITSSTPIFLALPGQATREQRIAALRVGAWECIAPPHDAEEILLKVNAYVRAKLDADRARSDGLLDPVTGLYNRQGLARRARELGSHAFREHGALACVALALDAEPGDRAGSAEEPPAAAVARSVHALKSSARVSDVIGRLAPAEFAVLAPGTDATGARRLAERLAQTIQARTAPAPDAADPADSARLPLRVRCGYDAVSNLGYAPIEPVELLVRASAALRTGKIESGGWLRRFEQGVVAAP